MTGMEEDKREVIPPYRMNQIMKTAASITALLVSGKHLYQPTYRECEIAIELVQDALKKSKNTGGNEDVSE